MSPTSTAQSQNFAFGSDKGALNFVLSGVQSTHYRLKNSYTCFQACSYYTLKVCTITPPKHKVVCLLASHALLLCTFKTWLVDLIFFFFLLSYASSVGAVHYTTSAKQNKGIHELFLDLSKSKYSPYLTPMHPLSHSTRCMYIHTTMYIHAHVPLSLALSSIKSTQ